MAKKKKKKLSGGKKPDWATAKTLCRLNAVEIQMAKELGMTPKSLTKNIPSTNQQWKTPVKFWIRDLYEKKFGDRTPQVPSEFRNTKTKPALPKRTAVNQPKEPCEDHAIYQQGDGDDDAESRQGP